jgi:CRISPR-associated protein Cas2
MFVVVAYDISDDRRRLRVMKMLQGYGHHVQESVFECDLEPAVYRKMVQRLHVLVKPEADNVRFYHLCRQDVRHIRTLGIGPAVQRAREFQIV